MCSANFQVSSQRIADISLFKVTVYSDRALYSKLAGTNVKGSNNSRDILDLFFCVHDYSLGIDHLISEHLYNNYIGIALT